MWFIGVELEQETSAPPPNKNPGSAPMSVTDFFGGGGNTCSKHDERFQGFSDDNFFTMAVIFLYLY